MAFEFLESDLKRKKCKKRLKKKSKIDSARQINGRVGLEDLFRTLHREGKGERERLGT